MLQWIKHWSERESGLIEAWEITTLGCTLFLGCMDEKQMLLCKIDNRYICRPSFSGGNGFALGKCTCGSMLIHRHMHTASKSEPEGAYLLPKVLCCMYDIADVIDSCFFRNCIILSHLWCSIVLSTARYRRKRWSFPLKYSYIPLRILFKSHQILLLIPNNIK